MAPDWWPIGSYGERPRIPRKLVVGVIVSAMCLLGFALRAPNAQATAGSPASRSSAQAESTVPSPSQGRSEATSRGQSSASADGDPSPGSQSASPIAGGPARSELAAQPASPKAPPGPSASSSVRPGPPASPSARRPAARSMPAGARSAIQSTSSTAPAGTRKGRGAPASSVGATATPPRGRSNRLVGGGASRRPAPVAPIEQARLTSESAAGTGSATPSSTTPPASAAGSTPASTPSAGLLVSGQSEYESAAFPLRGISNAFLGKRPPSASRSAPGTPLPPHEPNPGGSGPTAVPGSGIGISGSALALVGVLSFIMGQLILRVRIGQDLGSPTVVLPVLEHPG